MTLQAPPGPVSHFVLGSLTDFTQDPLGFLTRCAHEYGDIVYLRLFNQPVFVLNRPDYIEAVLVTHHHNFVKSRAVRETRVVLGNGLLTSEGEFWQRQRRLIQPAFHRKRIAAYGNVMVEYAERMLAEWHDAKTIDVHQAMMRVTLEIVAKTLFDANMADASDEVSNTLRDVLENFVARAKTGFVIPPSIPIPGNWRMQNATRQLQQMIDYMIAQRRAEGKDHGDLLSMLLEIQQADGAAMSDKQLRDEAITLFLAGHETTALALSWAWYLLSQHPETETRLWAELQRVLGDRPPTVADLPQLQYTQWVVHESMRLYPPVWVIGREAVQACEIGGYLIPAGSTVLMSQWVMHHDARYFAEPEEFKPERWADESAQHLPKYAYFPFGGGLRLCIGREFALAEASLLLATIAQKFQLTLVPDHLVITWPTITLRPAYGIWMTPHPR